MKPVAKFSMNTWLKIPLYGLIAFVSFQGFVTTSFPAVTIFTAIIKSSLSINAPDFIAFFYPLFFVYLLSFLYDQFNGEDKRSILHGFFACALWANPFMMGRLMESSHPIAGIIPSAYGLALIEVLCTMFSLRVANIPNVKMRPTFGIITAIFIAISGLSSAHYHLHRHAAITDDTPAQVSMMDTLQDQAWDAKAKLSEYGTQLTPQSSILIMLTLTFGVLLLSQLKSDTGHGARSVIASSLLDKKYEKLRASLNKKTGKGTPASLADAYGTDEQMNEYDDETNAPGARKLIKAANMFKSRKGRVVRDFAKNFPAPDPNQKHLG